jgi:hypothetical protein
MQFSTLRYWLKNLSRTIVVVTATFIAVSAYHNLHKVVGIAGVLLGGFIVMVVPSMIHNKLNESTNTAFDRCLNYFLIIYAIVGGLIVTTVVLYKEFTDDGSSSHH